VPRDAPVASLDRKQHLYLWLAGLFVTALVVADLIGGRFFRVGTVDLSAGMLLFPLTFVLTDVINEFYGPVGAKRITLLGLGAAGFALAFVNIAIELPPSAKGLPEATFREVLGMSRRLYVASLLAYLIGQFTDIAIFALLRRVTRHKLLWLRATGSTLVSQAIDTTVVTSILLAGKESTEAIARIVVHSYGVKILFAVGLTPVIYAAHAIILRGLKIDERPTVS
jgi:queuosine precursor transporter